MDFKRSNRKAWNLLRKIDHNTKRNRLNTKISPDAVANRIMELSRVTVDKKVRRNLKNKLGKLKADAEKETSYGNNFEEHEIDTAIKNIKLGKAAGLDEIYPEFNPAMVS